MANYNFNVGTSSGGSGNITTFTQGDTITFNVGTQGADWTLSLGRSSDAFITSWTGGSGTSGTWDSIPSGGGVATLNSNGTGFKVPIANSNSYELGGTVTLFKEGNSWFTVTIGRVKDTTTLGVSGTINYSNATVAIGSTFTVTVSGNASNGSYSYNQNGGSTNNRFTPAPASYAVTGSAPGNQFTATAIDPAGGLNSNGAATGFYNLKVGSLGGTNTIDTGPNKVIYKPVVSPSPSIALTTNNQVDGSWEVTLSESGGTTNGGSSTQFRFINGSNVELQGWSTDNTYSNVGSTRPVSVKGQIREVGVYNTSTSAETGLVSVPTIAPDRSITVNGNAPASPTTTSAFTKALTGNTFLANAQTTDTIAIVGAQIGDEIRVIKSATGTELVPFFEITATSFNISVPTSTGAFFAGTSELVKVQIRRSVARGGDNVNGTALSYTYSRNLNQASARLLTSGGTDITFGATSTIGATAYIAAANGSTGADTAMDLVVSSGSASGTDYRIKVTSGTTNGGDGAGTGFTPVPSGSVTTSFTTFLAESRLPDRTNSVGYIIEARDSSSAGDNVWYECYRTVGGVFAGTQFKASFTVTRSDYVAVNNILSNITITGTGVNLAQNNDYIIAFNNTTVNPIPSSAGTGRQSNQEYRMNNGATPGSGSEVLYNSFGLGTGALTGSAIPNNSINVGLLTNVAQRWLWTRVPASQNGNGSWTQCSTGSVFVAARVYRDTEIISPTIISGYPIGVLDSGDLSKMVPIIKIADTAGFNPTGNGATDIAWSTVTATPSNWTQVLSNDTNGINNFFASANFNLSKTTTTVYVGIRRRSTATGFTSTPSYASQSIPGGNLIYSAGGINAFGVLNQVNGNLSSDLIANNSQIRLFEGDTLNETIEFRGLSNSNETSVAQSQGPAASILSSSFLQSDYGIDIVSGTTQGGQTSGANVDSALLPSGDTILTLTLSNPSELPTNTNTVNYEFYYRLATSRGGNGVKQYPTNSNPPETEFSAKRFLSLDNTNISAIPAKTTLTASGDTTLNVTISGGSSPTNYRLVNTTSSINIVDTQTGDGTIVIANSELPLENSSASYKVQARLSIADGGVSNSYFDCTGPNSTFTLNRLADADGGVTISVPETQFYNQVATFQTIGLAFGNSNTEYQIIVTAGSPNTPVSSNPVAGPTTADASGDASFSLNPSSDVPEEGGDIVEYQVQFREVGSAAAFANCTGTNTLFKLAALDADSIILSDGVPNGDRATNTTYDTSPLTINGIASTQTFSISGTSAQFKVNSGTMDATNKSVSEGDTIVVRLTTSGVENTARTATLGFPGLTSNTKTWTLTTGTGTGTGTGGGGPGGDSGTYGLEIYNSSGNSLIDQNSRVARAVSSGVISSLAGGGTTSSAISVTGLTNTDDWTIVVTVALTPLAAGQPSKFSVNKGTGSFTITNNTEEQEPSSNDDQRRFYWWAFKSA